MSLALAALLPHLAHPSEPDLAKAASIGAATKQVAAALNAAKVGTVVVLQAAPFTPTDAFTPPAADPGAVNVLGLDKASSGSTVFDNDNAFIEELATRARPAGWAVKQLPQIEFDAATLAALASVGLTEGADAEDAPKLVVATLPYRAPADMVDFGLVVGGVAKQAEQPVAVIAVANLSSRLTGPSAKPEAAAFDETFKKAAADGDFGALLRYDLVSLEAAGEEASRPLAVIYGAVRGAASKFAPKLLAYEAPATTGYAVVTWS